MLLFVFYFVCVKMGCDHLHRILFQKRDFNKAEEDKKKTFIQEERKKAVERLKQYKMVGKLTVWNEVIFQHLNDYNSANMPDIYKNPFDYCLDINS